MEKIHPEGKIDIHNSENRYQYSLNNLSKDKEIIPANKKIILEFIRDCRLGKTIKKGAKKKIEYKRCMKYIYGLRNLSSWLNKPFQKVALKDIENFVERLEDNKILSTKKKPYADESKSDLKKTLRKFYNWMGKPHLVDWLDTTTKRKDYEALRKEDVTKLVNRVPSVRDKCLIMFLFDSGARIEEALNVRLKHLEWKDKLGCYMLRIEFSKTKQRTISIPLCNEYIKDWLKEHHTPKNKEAQLFPMSYSNILKILARATKKVFGKTYSPHSLRHSSATYYANLLKNSFKLDYRYGWVIGSEMSRRYIDRTGINEEETVDVVKADENQQLRKEIEVMRNDITFLKEVLYKAEAQMLKS